MSTDSQRLARRTDPETSHEAAEQHVVSGKADTHRRIVYAAVLNHPRWTSAEYAKHTGLERHEAARRLSDLKNDGLVVQGKARRCVVRGTRAVTWYAAKER